MFKKIVIAAIGFLLLISCSGSQINFYAKDSGKVINEIEYTFYGEIIKNTMYSEKYIFTINGKNVGIKPYKYDRKDAYLYSKVTKKTYYTSDHFSNDTIINLNPDETFRIQFYDITIPNFNIDQQYEVHYKNIIFHFTELGKS